MENDKAWEIRSDEWIESMNASSLFKERRLQKKLVDSKLKEDALSNIEHHKQDPYTVKKLG